MDVFRVAWLAFGLAAVPAFPQQPHIIWSRGSCGYAQAGGRVVIQPQYRACGPFSEGVAAVRPNDRWGYIDAQRRTVAEPLFEEARPMKEFRAAVKLNGKYGFVDRSGALVVAAIYDQVRDFSEELAAVRTGNKWGYLNLSGKMKLLAQFEAAGDFHSGWARVSAGGRVVMIDPDGSITTPSGPSLEKTFRRLQAIEVTEREDVPRFVIARILALYKIQLRGLTVRELNRAHSVEPEELKTALEKALAKFRSERTPGEQTANPYGLIDSVEVHRPPQHPELLSVLVHIALPRAVDTSLLLFSRQGPEWRMIFAADNLGHTQLTPPECTAAQPDGSFVMMLAGHSGRYARGGYSLAVELVRFDAGLQGHVIFQSNFPALAHQIALDSDGFRLETLSTGFDAVRGRRPFPYRYRIRGDAVTRVAPIAFNPQDFVEEWGHLPWAEAVPWSDPDATALRAWHEKLRGPYGFFDGEIPETRVCPGERPTWEVEFKKPEDRRTLFFTVERLDNWTFRMKNVSRRPAAGCRRPDDTKFPATMFAKPLEF